MFKSLPLATTGCYLCNRFVTKAVINEENLPQPGQAAIVVANHNSLYDGIGLCAELSWRTHLPTHPLVTAQPFAHFFFGWFLRCGKAIPLDRRSPTGVAQALRTALGYLRRGEMVVIFPEGHLNNGVYLRLARPGAALLALESGAPIYPCGIRGSDRVFPLDDRPQIKRRISFHCGKPFATDGLSEQYHHAAAPERQVLIKNLSAAIMTEISTLAALPIHRRQLSV